MRLRVGACTDAGRQRSDNQDYLLYRVRTAEPDAVADASLFIAADGVGGAAGGACASRLAACVAAAVFPRDGGTDPAASFAHAVNVADRAVTLTARKDATLKGMATTLVAAFVREGVFWIANVGDSRGYLIRGGVARQVTEDHSLVAERVRAGTLSEAQAAVSAHRHYITRSIGTGEDVETDVFGPYALEPGDRLLLCTDGLTETMDAAEIAALALAADPEDAARALVDAANAHGGPDNISVLIVMASAEQ